MKNLLVGNGINIQFDNINYTTQQIVLRILKNCDRDDFPSHIIVNFPYLLKNIIGQLYLEARKIINGEYDSSPNCSAEKKSLQSFKDRYSKQVSTLRITDIRFEDYYLIHDLACHKYNIQNPDQFYSREGMRVAYLYAIYNDGQLNKLYLNYPTKFNDFLSSFDNIFTTNYDSNIENAINRDIFHIHGQFDVKSDVYNPDSFRNQLPDAPIKEYEIDENYFYLYSNALTTHCGEYKEFQIKQCSNANSVIEKMANAYLSDESLRREIDNWTNDSNKITANLGYSIQLKAKYPELTFSDNYHFDKLQSITGELTILGLSPWNDFHIFETINNATLDNCIFYYFNENECDTIKNLLPSLTATNKLQFEYVKKFWENLK